MQDEKKIFQTPLSELSRLSISLRKPNGELFNDSVDDLKIFKVEYELMNRQYLKIVTNKFFDKNEFYKGDTVVLRDYALVLLSQTMTTSAMRTLENYINRTQGHEVIELGQANDSGYYRNFYINYMKLLLLVILGGFIGWLLMPKKNANNTLSMEDIVDNDPVIKELDKRIEDINKKASERMIIEKPWMKDLLEKNGYNPNDLTKEELIEKKKNKIDTLKKEKIEKIEQYFNLGYINEKEKQYYINNWIENKEEHIFPEYNFISTKNLKDTDEETWGYLLSELDNLLENNKKEHELSIEYGNNIAHRIIKNEVWLNMTESQLNESRGYPDETEQELTPNGEIEIFIYGNKQSGSYFTLQDGKVIKIKDRQKKEY